jgi:hypothetical protein
MYVLSIAVAFTLVPLTILYCIEQSKKRRVSLWIAILLCVVCTPFIGAAIIGLLRPRVLFTCYNCGNSKSEKPYCFAGSTDLMALDATQSNANINGR